MPNNLDIDEVTLLQASDSTNAVNADGPWDRPKVIRITDHVSNTVAEEDDGELMALFERPRKGHPWERRGTHLSNVLFQQEAIPVAVPTNTEVLFPDFDYSTFE